MNIWTKTILLTILFTSPFAQAKEISLHIPEYISYESIFANSDGTISFIEPRVKVDNQWFKIANESNNFLCGSLGNFLFQSQERKFADLTAYSHEERELVRTDSYDHITRCAQITGAKPNLKKPGKKITLTIPPVTFSKFFIDDYGDSVYKKPRIKVDGKDYFVGADSAEFICKLMNQKYVRQDSEFIGFADQKIQSKFSKYHIDGYNYITKLYCSSEKGEFYELVD